MGLRRCAYEGCETQIAHDKPLCRLHYRDELRERERDRASRLDAQIGRATHSRIERFYRGGADPRRAARA